MNDYIAIIKTVITGGLTLSLSVFLGLWMFFSTAIIFLEYKGATVACNVKHEVVENAKDE